MKAVLYSLLTLLLFLAEVAQGDVQRNIYPPNWGLAGQCLEPHSHGGLLNFTLDPCTPLQQQTALSPHHKVVIVGGGPAGVSMARLLFDRGVIDITLLEKTGRIGGKSLSYRDEFGNHVEDLGTTYFSAKYECIETWGDLMNMTELEIDRNFDRVITSNQTSANVDMTPPRYGSFVQYVLDYLSRNYGIEFIDFIVGVLPAIDTYKSHWIATMGSTDHYFPSEDSVNFDDLNMTIGAWLEQRQLQILVPMFKFVLTAQMYGDLDTLPAFYGLMWVHPNIVALLIYRLGSISVWKEGFEEYWARLLRDTSVDVRMNVDISRIERSEAPREVLVYVEGATEPERFDYLIVASPMPDSLSFLDRTKREVELFSKFTFREVVVSIVDFPDGVGVLPDDFQVFTWADRLGNGTDGQTDYYAATFDGESESVSREMMIADGDEGPITIRHTNIVHDADHTLSVMYQVASLETSNETLKEKLLDELAQFDIKISSEQIKTQKRWEAFPYFSQEDILEHRKPWRIWDMQGERNTWFVGSYASFESVADVVDYNLKLVNAKLCPSRLWVPPGDDSNPSGPDTEEAFAREEESYWTTWSSWLQTP